MSDIFQFPDERVSKGDTFRCRKCRVYLFCFDHLSPFHEKVEPVDQCSAWYIDSDEIDGNEGEETLAWIKDAVDKSQWTEGKLYCPKCTSRIGSFNFTQGVRCSCFTFIIPAIWIQKCKVDQTSTSDSKPNIRLPDTHDDNSDRSRDNQGRGVMYYMETGPTGSQVTQTCSDSSSSGSRTNESGSQHKIDSANDKTLACSGRTESCTWAHVLNQEISLEASNQDYQTDSRQTRLRNCQGNLEHPSQTCDNNIDPKDSNKQSRSLSSSQGNPLHTSNTDINHEVESSRIYRRKINRQKELNQFQRGELFDSINGHFEEVTSSGLVGHIDKDGGSRFELLGEMEQKYHLDKEITDHAEKHQVYREDEDIPDHITCPVCLDLLYEPLECPCTHMFCDSCLRILNSKSRHSVPRCPLCRKSIYYVYPAIEIREEIKKSYSKVYEARHKIERRAPHRRLPLPFGRIKPRQKRSTRLPDIAMPYSVLVVLACVLACCGLCLLTLFVFCPPTHNRCITVLGYEWLNGY